MKLRAAVIALLFTVTPALAQEGFLPPESWEEEEPQAPQSFDTQEPEAADSEPLPGETDPAMLDSPPPLPKTDTTPVFEGETKWVELPFAKLQGLNKVTARTSEIIVKMGEKVKFGNLEITVTKCHKKEASEKNEAVALIEIWDEIPGQTRNKDFYGWMFSTSPAISALEHPIYDVTLLNCKKTKEAETKESGSPAKNDEQKTTGKKP